MQHAGRTLGRQLGKLVFIRPRLRVGRQSLSKHVEHPTKSTISDSLQQIRWSATESLYERMAGPLPHETCSALQ